MKACMRVFAGVLGGLLLTVFIAVSGQAQTMRPPSEGIGAPPIEKKDYEAFDLGELYVKGDRIQGVPQMTQSTEITAADIEATNSRTVAEALAHANGVKVSTGRKAEPNVQIHGLDQVRTLVLIDGVPYYETNYGKLDLNQLPVDNVAKIEIQKGVSSVLYGPNALAGVINIVTKKPTEKFALNALAEYGDYESSRYSISNGMKIGKVSYWLNYSHQESKGWYLSRDFTPRRGTMTVNRTTTTYPVLEDGGVREDSESRTDAFWAKVGIEPTPTSEYYINYHYIEKSKGMPAPIGPTIVDTVTTTAGRGFSQFGSIPTYNNWGMDLSGQQKIGDRVTLKGKLFYHDHADEYISYRDQYHSSIIATSRYKDNTLGGSFLSDIKIIPTDTLRFAFNYRRDDHKERAYDNWPYAHSVSYTGSLGIENEFNPTKNLSLVAGLADDWFRVDKAERNTNTGSNVTSQVTAKPGYHDEFDPMLGATYSFDDGTKVFGSFAKKVRFPTLQQLFSSTSGNVDLLAERAWNYVLGASRPITQYARAELSFFYHDISNYITRDQPTPDSRYYNLGRITLKGLEVSGEVFPAKDLSFSAAYTYIDATNLTHGRITERVQYVPGHQVDLGMKYLVPLVDVKLDLNALYVSQTWGQLPAASDTSRKAAIRTDEYFIVNARVAKAIGRNVELYFAVNNIFDKDYEAELDFPSPGRNIYGGIKYSF
jgi:iron complex outermembrane recepter protein